MESKENNKRIGYRIYLSGTLTIVARKCRYKYRHKNNLVDLFNIIIDELKKEDATVQYKYESWVNGIEKLLRTTINVNDAIEFEKQAIFNAINATLVGMDNPIELYENLRRLIVLNKTEYDVFLYYVEPEKRKLNYELLVRIVYVYGLIKYQYYLQNKKEVKEQGPKNDNKSNPKYHAKYYALYHWMLIDMGKEDPFPRDQNDHYCKKNIEQYGINKYKLSDGQGFYRIFKDINIKNRIGLSIEFGSGYKDKIIDISNNDALVIKYLKDWPK